MALKTVGDLKESVSGILSGTNLSNVTNLNGALERAVRVMSQKIAIPEATGRASYSIYDGVYDYAAPATIFGGALLDFRPQGVSRMPWDEVYRQPIELFDQTKAILPNGAAVTFEYNKGVPIMRVAETRARSMILVDAMNLTTGWVAAGSASGLTEDDTVYYQSPASLRFLLTGASTGTLTKTLTTPLDLSDYEDVGVAFLAIRIPDGATSTNLTSVSVKLGSSATAYNSVTNTTGFVGAWTSGEWLLVALDFSGASEVGAPDWSAIDYIQVSIVHAATLTNFRVGYLFISLPSPYDLIYKTAAIFNQSGTLSQTISTDSDSIILNDSAYAIYEYEAAYAIAFQNGGTLSGGILSTIASILNGARAKNGAVLNLGLYDLYRAANPSEELKTVGSYID